MDFYPRSPCGERRVTVLGIQHRVGISIHALLAESDVNDAINGCNSDFISIHALLAESDNSKRRCLPEYTHFYPRSPCGERLTGEGIGLYLVTISIHALLAESDRLDWYSTAFTISISIHALLAESDHKYHRVDRVRACISIHALLAESDRIYC